MADIKAIQTVFDGHKFRSRLEARWAVFFHELGMDYEYELEGYQLESGAKYLPDFFVPSLNIHVEVKPHPKIPKNDLLKMVEFGSDANKPLLLIVGTPSAEKMYLICRNTVTSRAEYEADYAETTDDDFWESFFINHEDARVIFTAPIASHGWCLAYKELPPWHDCHFAQAILKAKQARFEFGQK